MNSVSDALRRDERRGRAQRVLRLVLSYGLAAACLYWVFHDIDASQFFGALKDVEWVWVVPAVVLNVLVYVLAAWEWGLLLRPVGRLTLGQSNRAIFVGRFANDVLPVHIGYVFRVYLAARDLNTRITAVLYSLLVERLFDGFWLALGIGLTAAFFPLPGNLRGTAMVWGAVILAGSIAFLLIVLREQKRGEIEGAGGAWAGRWAALRRFQGFADELVGGLRTIGKSPLIFAALGISILKFVFQAAAFLALLWAYGFRFPFWVQMALFLIAYVGISVPSTPASMGVFQFFCAAGLIMLHVPKSIASSFALFAFVLLTLPLAIAGFIAVGQTGMTFRQLRDATRQWQKPPNNGSTPPTS